MFQMCLIINESPRPHRDLPYTNTFGPGYAFDLAAPSPHPKGLYNPQGDGLGKHLVRLAQALSPDNPHGQLPSIEWPFGAQRVHANLGRLATPQNAVQVNVGRQVRRLACGLKEPQGRIDMRQVVLRFPQQPFVVRYRP